LLAHEADEVRVAVLTHLGTTETLLHHAEVRELLRDAASQVRASATLALCAMRHGDAVVDVQPMLQDPDPHVRACAVAGLIKHGGLDGVLSCAEPLKRMLASPKGNDREYAAWILGEVGVQNFYQPIVPLFEDPSEQVRHAAIVAAGRLKSPKLITALIAQLGRPRLATVAVQALASFGPSIIECVTPLLENSRTPTRVRAQVPRILARIPEHKSVDWLRDLLRDHETDVRAAAIQGLATLSNRMPNVRLDMAAIAAAIRAESETYFNLLGQELDLALDDSVPLLRDALHHREAQCQARLFGLLSLKYPGETIDLVNRNLMSSQATTRANAIEVLDNLLPNDEKPYVIPLVEEAPVDRKLKAGSDLFTLTRQSREACLTSLITSHDDWLQICAATAIAAWRVPNLEAHVKELLASDNPVCRETAIHALKELGAGAYLRAQADLLVADTAPAVSRYARFVLTALEA